MAPQKKVEVKVATKEDLKGVEALELRIDKLKKQSIQLEIDSNTKKLDETRAKIDELKNQKANLDVDADASEIKKIEAQLASLEQEAINLELKVESGELQKAKAEAEDLDGTTIDVDVNNIKAMEAVDQIGQGFDRLKQGASEVGQQFGVLLDKAGEAEQNKAFLEIGFNKAGSKQAEKDAIDAQKRIQDIVAKAPGDDTAMNSILSSAVAKDIKLMDKDMQGFANSVSDYFAGAEVNGKHAAEAIQDVRSYITSGNVAELETTGIFDQSQLEQLKNIDDVGERVAKFQEMVNQSSYAGLGTADTLNNKWAEFGGMMDKSRTQLGGFFTDATKGTLDWLLKLNDATEGLAGIGLALVQMASPLTDTLMGLGQMATGIKAIGDLAPFGKIGDALGGVKTKVLDLASTIKTSLMGAFTSLKTTMTSTIIPALRNVATSFFNAGRAALTAGLNALKTVGMWAAQKLALVASTLAEYGLAAAQAVLNFVMSMNPIMLIVLALAALVGALLWAYYNVDWFREMVDNAWASLVQIGQIIYGYVMGAIQWLSDLFNNFTSQLGLNTTDWVQAIIGFILFLPTLPLQVGIALVNTIAKALGFKGNFVQTLWQTAVDAVNRFKEAIQGIWQAVKQCLDWAYQIVMSHPLVQAAIWLGQAIANGFSALGLGQNSPGRIVKSIKQELNWTRDEIDNSNLPGRSSKLGEDIVKSFGNPKLNVGYEENKDIRLRNHDIGNDKNNSSKYRDIIINIENLNDEKYIDIIIDKITRLLDFDNETAGRKV